MGMGQGQEFEDGNGKRAEISEDLAGQEFGALNVPLK